MEQKCENTRLGPHNGSKKDNNQTPQVKGRGDTNICELCDSPFKFLVNRRFTCHGCTRQVCADCAQMKVKVRFFGTERLCISCFDHQPKNIRRDVNEHFFGRRMNSDLSDSSLFSDALRRESMPNMFHANTWRSSRCPPYGGELPEDASMSDKENVDPDEDREAHDKKLGERQCVTEKERPPSPKFGHETTTTTTQCEPSESSPSSPVAASRGVTHMCTLESTNPNARGMQKEPVVRPFVNLKLAKPKLQIPLLKLNNLQRVINNGAQQFNEVGGTHEGELTPPISEESESDAEVTRTSDKDNFMTPMSATTGKQGSEQPTPSFGMHAGEGPSSSSSLPREKVQEKVKTEDAAKWTPTCAGRLGTSPMMWKGGLPVIPNLQRPLRQRAETIGAWTPRKGPPVHDSVRIPPIILNEATTHNDRKIENPTAGGVQKLGRLWEINASLSKQIAELTKELQRVAKHSNVTPGSMLGTPRGNCPAVKNDHLNKKLEKLMEQLENLESMKPKDNPPLEQVTVIPEKLQNDKVAASAESSAASPSGAVKQKLPAEIQAHGPGWTPKPWLLSSNIRRFSGTNTYKGMRFDDASPKSMTESVRSIMTSTSLVPTQPPGDLQATISVRRNRYWVKRFVSVKGATFAYSKADNGPTRFRASLPDYTLRYVGACKEGHRLALLLKDPSRHEALQLLLPTREEAKRWYAALFWGLNCPKPASNPTTSVGDGEKDDLDSACSSPHSSSLREGDQNSLGSPSHDKDNLSKSSSKRQSKQKVKTRVFYAK